MTAVSWRRLPPAPLVFEAGQTSVWTGQAVDRVRDSRAPARTATCSTRPEAALAYNPARATPGAGSRIAAEDGHVLPSARGLDRQGDARLGLLASWRTTRRADAWRRLPQPPSGAGESSSGPGASCSAGAAAAAETPLRKARPTTRTRRMWRQVAESPLAPEQQPLGVWTGRELVLFVSGISAVERKAAPARARARSCVRPGDRRVAPDRAAAGDPQRSKCQLDRSRGSRRRRHKRTGPSGFGRPGLQSSFEPLATNSLRWLATRKEWLCGPGSGS